MAAGDSTAIERMLADPYPPRPRPEAQRASAVATLAEASGDFERAVELHREAAARWEAFGHVFEHGHALFGAGRTLLALAGDRTSGELANARAVFARLGALRQHDVSFSTCEVANLTSC